MRVTLHIHEVMRVCELPRGIDQIEESSSVLTDDGRRELIRILRKFRKLEAGP